MFLAKDEVLENAEHIARKVKKPRFSLKNNININTNHNYSFKQQQQQQQRSHQGCGFFTILLEQELCHFCGN
jgi:hypothetical protein